MSDFERSINPQTNDDAPDDQVKAAADSQVIYYEGSPRLRGEIGTLLIWTMLGLLAIVIPALLLYSNSIQTYWPLVIGIIIAIICWVIPSLIVRKNYYRITNYRIDHEHGLLFKNSDTLELWHVDDVSLRQGPLDRIFNVGTITVVSNDSTTPRLELRSLDNPRKLLETLKTRIIAVKRQRGVVKMDLG